MEKEIDLLLNPEYKNQFPELVNKFHIKYVEIKRNRALYDYFIPFLVKDFKSYDIVFSPNYITTAPFIGNSTKYITTIHDLQYLHFPEFFSKLKRNWQYLAHKNTLKKSDVVICISDFVKKDIIKRFGEKYAPKLKVIHNPIDFNKLQHYSENIGSKYNFPFILSVAAHYPHKNILNLVKAFQVFNEKYPDVKLILAGQLSKNLKGGNYEKYGIDLQKETDKNKNIIITGYVQDDELAVLFNKCALFVFPSIFEGFGMPPVEAMSLGKPVITTKCGSLEEVTLNKAIYIQDPHDVDELVSLMNKSYDNLVNVTNTAQLNASIIKEYYNPKKIAREYLKLFEKV